MMHLSGNLSDYGIVFVAGILASFTPCLYPLIPATISFIAGVNTRGTKKTAFIVSLVYVLGLAVTYSILGVIAALTGQVFGQMQAFPVFYLIGGLIVLLFSLTMFEIVRLPFFGFHVHAPTKPRNLAAVLFFGMTVGLFVGPCLVPILGSLLVYVASKKNIVYGASLLFVFSYGLGASLILAGTFSSALSHMPKSGKWLVYVKKLCAVVLFIFAIYLLVKGSLLFPKIK